MTVTVPPDAPLVVYRLSESFGEFWPLLATELGVPLLVYEASAAEPAPPGALVVIVAGGGAEADIAPLIVRLSAPGSVPLVAAGAST